MPNSNFVEIKAAVTGNLKPLPVANPMDHSRRVGGFATTDLGRASDIERSQTGMMLMTKKLLLLAGIGILALSACKKHDTPAAENVAEAYDNTADAMEANASNMHDMADNAGAAVEATIDNKADAVENKADAVRAAGENKADAIDAKADKK